MKRKSEARVTAGAKGMTYSFVTTNTCVENERIDMTLDEGPFEVLEGSWVFKALSDEGCRIDLTLEFVASRYVVCVTQPHGQCGCRPHGGGFYAKNSGRR